MPGLTTILNVMLRRGRQPLGALARINRWEWVAIGLLIILAATNVYRAATQSITIDEAFTYNEFVAGRFARIYQTYDANNHVLHTLLCRASVALFGLSELSLRVPSLIGGFLYLYAAFLVCRRLFGRKWLFLLTTALITLNPGLLDFLSIARGYGLALGCMMWALYHLLGLFPAPDAGAAEPATRLYKPAVALALSVAFNLVFLVPALLLSGLYVLAQLADARRHGGRGALSRRLSSMSDHFLVPLAVVAFLLLFLPLSQASADKFYYGARTLADSFENLVENSLFHHWVFQWFGVALDYSRFWPRVLRAAWVVVPALLGLTAIIWALLAGRAAWKGGFHALRPPERLLYLGGGTLLLSILASVAANRWFGVPYPLTRTGIYWLPLTVLCVSSLVTLLDPAPRVRATVGAPAAALAALLIFQFAMQFQTDHYGEWTMHSDLRRIVNLVRERQAARGQARVKVAASWPLAAGLNFYRAMYRMDWLEPVTREGLGAGGDYYIVSHEDAGWLKKLPLEVIYRGASSGTVLAVPAK